MVDAWNNFLKEPSKVLKRLKISMQCEYHKLENLSLCQNLDEFCLEGRVSYDDMKRVFQMKSLKKLELKDVPIVIVSCHGGNNNKNYFLTGKLKKLKI